MAPGLAAPRGWAMRASQAKLEPKDFCLAMELAWGACPRLAPQVDDSRR